MSACGVSFVDLDGIRHSVELEADSLYEAAVLAIKTFRQHRCEPPANANLEIEVRTSITHTLPIKKVHAWLKQGARSPREAVIKERLRDLMQPTSSTPQA
jgi:hypothetical protein